MKRHIKKQDIKIKCYLKLFSDHQMLSQYKPPQKLQFTVLKVKTSF